MHSSEAKNPRLRVPKVGTRNSFIIVRTSCCTKIPLNPIRYPLYAIRWEFARLQLYCPDSKQPPPKKRRKRAGAQRQKTKILKNSYSCLYKHLRFSKLQKYPNFRTKRAGRPKYEGYMDTPARLFLRCHYGYQEDPDAPHRFLPG